MSDPAAPRRRVRVRIAGSVLWVALPEVSEPLPSFVERAARSAAAIGAAAEAPAARLRVFIDGAELPLFRYEVLSARI